MNRLVVAKLVTRIVSDNNYGYTFFKDLFVNLNSIVEYLRENFYCIATKFIFSEIIVYLGKADPFTHFSRYIHRTPLSPLN